MSSAVAGLAFAASFDLRPGRDDTDERGGRAVDEGRAFMASEKACDFVVVHGHTPEDEPADKRWRIGIDSGAYATGVLTAVRLKDVSRRIIQVRL